MQIKQELENLNLKVLMIQREMLLLKKALREHDKEFAQRVAKLEDNQLFLEQEQGWQGQDLKEIQKKFEVLEQQVSSIKMEKMIFDNP